MRHMYLPDSGRKTVGYWCRVTAWSGDLTREFALGSYAAKNPRLAVRWLRGQAYRLANALDPEPGVGWAKGDAASALRRLPDSVADSQANPGRALREWALDMTSHEQVMAYLLTGTPYFMTVSDPSAYYMLSSEPMVISSPTDWRRRRTTAAAAFL